MSIFDKIPDVDFEDNMETRISNHKMQLFTSKRKDLLFNRHRKEQEEKLTHQRAEVEKRLPIRDLSSSTRIAKNDFTLRNEVLNKTETFTITTDDLDKLRPETDTNDTVIGSYIKLMQLMWLPVERDQKCHIFSSFFLEKLIGEYVKEEIVYDKDPVLLLEQVQAKARENYKNVKRWTKKIDIFEKDLLVFPINAFRHWFCIIVLRPGSLLAAQPACELVYCDSMFDQRDFVAEAIRKYLECELEDKKTVKLVLDKERVPCYQLLVLLPLCSCPVKPTLMTAAST
jgi:Ulp1 family protease